MTIYSTAIHLPKKTFPEFMHGRQLATISRSRSSYSTKFRAIKMEPLHTGYIMTISSKALSRSGSSGETTFAWKKMVLLVMEVVQRRRKTAS